MKSLLALVLAGTTATQILSGDVVVTVDTRPDAGSVLFRCSEKPMGDAGMVLRYCVPEGV